MTATSKRKMTTPASTEPKKMAQHNKNLFQFYPNRWVISPEIPCGMSSTPIFRKSDGLKMQINANIHIVMLPKISIINAGNIIKCFPFAAPAISSAFEITSMMRLPQ